MFTALLLVTLSASAEQPVPETCSAIVTFGGRSTVTDIKVRACSDALHPDVAYRAGQVPWNLVLDPVLDAMGKGRDTADWRATVDIWVQPLAPSHTLPTHDKTAPQNPDKVPLSDRFRAPAADRRVELRALSLQPPPDGLAMLASVGSVMAGAAFPMQIEGDSIVVYSRAAERRREKKGKRGGNFSECTPWLVFDAAGKPTDLATHPDQACRNLPSVFVEALLWRWSPPRWDETPLPVGVPLAQVGIGRFRIADGPRFAPFDVGDVLVNDVPFALDVAKGGRPDLVKPPTMEVPMVFPELLESRLGIADASRITCDVHLWAAPGRLHAYALAVRDCPDFFRNVVSAAYAQVMVDPPERATHHVETVVFAFDDSAETWKITRQESPTDSPGR